MRQIPQCQKLCYLFNSDLWDGLTGRVEQMISTNSSASKINWATKIDNHSMRLRMIKSVGNILYLRGDGVFNKSTEQCDVLFEDPEIYAHEIKTNRF